MGAALVLLGVTTTVSGIGDPVPPARLRTLDAFVSAFRLAFAGEDPAAPRRLFYWSGVSVAQREQVYRLIAQDMERELRRVALIPPRATPTTLEGEGSAPRPNLTVVIHLLAEFHDGSGSRHFSLHDVGVRDGVYYIALTVAPGN